MFNHYRLCNHDFKCFNIDQLEFRRQDNFKSVIIFAHFNINIKQHDNYKCSKFFIYFNSYYKFSLFLFMRTKMDVFNSLISTINLYVFHIFHHTFSYTHISSQMRHPYVFQLECYYFCICFGFTFQRFL